MKEFFILTIFPEIIKTYASYGILKQAIAKEKVRVEALNLREFAPKGEVDDTAFGGLPGMVLKPEPIFKAYEKISETYGQPFVILPEPWGKPLDQRVIERIGEEERIMIICGRYEGVDDRVRSITDLEVSVGDFILSGGELPALMITEAVARLQPGVLNEPESLKRDSFGGRWLGYPVYTRPREFKGMKVPDILLSGNHRLIELWTLYHSIKNTLENRPSMIPRDLTETESSMLDYIRKGMPFEEWMKDRLNNPS